jgi:hypothetical protein
MTVPPQGVSSSYLALRAKYACGAAPRWTLSQGGENAMNRLTYLPKGSCEIGFENEVVLIEEAVHQAIIATLLRMTARRSP